MVAHLQYMYMMLYMIPAKKRTHPTGNLSCLQVPKKI